MFISQNSKISPGHYGGPHITPQLSQFSQIKTSEILNCSNDTSQLSSLYSSKGSKLVEVRSVPSFKNQMMSITPSTAQDRINSPININNYINIYTAKNSQQKGPQISFTNPNPNGLNQGYSSGYRPPLMGGYANHSYDKSLVNSSYKAAHHSYTNGGSLERAKFSSLDKPAAHTGGSFLKNAYYQNATPAGRAYLSNFRERMNPGQKIKKSYRTSERSGFNFMTPVSPFVKY
jgi:hypothetical protein